MSSEDQRVYAPRPTSEEKSVIVVTIPQPLVQAAQAAHADLYQLPRTVQAMVGMIAQPPIIRPRGSRYVHNSMQVARENNRYVEWQRTLMVHLLEALPPPLAKLVFGMYGTACEEMTHQGAICLTGESVTLRKSRQYGLSLCRVLSLCASMAGPNDGEIMYTAKKCNVRRRWSSCHV